MTQGAYVPGVLRCAKCDFRLQKITLHVLDGGSSANNEPDRCPNCDVPMWRVSWQDEAKDAYRVVESQVERAVTAERKLNGAKAIAEEIRDLLLERIHGSPARSPAHNARVRAESLITFLSYTEGETRG